MPSLLEKAKQLKRKTTKLSNEELELVEAWLNGEVNNQQIIEVTKINNGVGVYVLLANGAKELWNRS